jgi:hypothetical protein
MYFQSQMFLVCLTALTLPPGGLLSIAQSRSDAIPLALAGITAALNLMVYGPRTRQAMIERIHQGISYPLSKLSGSSISILAVRHVVLWKLRLSIETRDAKAVQGGLSPGPEMQAMNRNFSKNHAMSIHLNLLTIGATLWYGLRLASRISLTY